MTVKTKGFTHIINLSDFVEAGVRESGIKEGIGCITVAGSTAGVTTIEYEAGLIEDFRRACERLFPENIFYAHNERWGDGNGFSHIRASFLGSSFSFLVHGGEAELGTWQQVVLVDFDNRPRTRRVVMHIVGE
ncbi:MAG: secondary thiamine-phosphate synthase enzyme YjbQ [bacterium JZ-2024 1]